MLFSKKSIAPIVEALIFREKRHTDEVHIHFVTKKKICELHNQFFQDPSPTDCITLPIDDHHIKGEPHVLGEAFICPKTALEYAKNSKSNTYEELTLYLIHCLLHLLGYDDIKPKERKIMRTKEKSHMAYLKKNNLLIKL